MARNGVWIGIVIGVIIGFSIAFVALVESPTIQTTEPSLRSMSARADLARRWRR